MVGAIVMLNESIDGQKSVCAIIINMFLPFYPCFPLYHCFRQISLIIFC